jgi:hypothetical protein
MHPESYRTIWLVGLLRNQNKAIPDLCPKLDSVTKASNSSVRFAGNLGRAAYRRTNRVNSPCVIVHF